MEYPKFKFDQVGNDEIYMVVEINKATGNIKPIIACWSHADAQKHLDLTYPKDYEYEECDYIDRLVLGPVKLEHKSNFFTPRFKPDPSTPVFPDPDMPPMFPRPTGPPSVPTMQPPDFMKPVKPMNPPNPLNPPKPPGFF